MSRMKDFYLTIAEALSEERCAAEHGIPMDIPAFLNALSDAGYVIVPRAALNSRTQCPPDRDIPDDIPTAYQDDPPY